MNLFAIDTLMVHEMRLIDFNDDWKEYFKSFEEELLVLFMGQKVNTIEHIGATSVVLCGTAGSIDILVSIPDAIEFITLKNILLKRGKGYSFVVSRSDYLNHMFFIKRNKKHEIVATIRIVEYASDEYNRIKGFQQYLKQKSDHVIKYNEFREVALNRCGGNNKKYQLAKENYIKEIVETYTKVQK